MIPGYFTQEGQFTLQAAHAFKIGKEHQQAALGYFIAYKCIEFFEIAFEVTRFLVVQYLQHRIHLRGPLIGREKRAQFFRESDDAGFILFEQGEKSPVLPRK
jgi:hypothetical protein